MSSARSSFNRVITHPPCTASHQALIPLQPAPAPAILCQFFHEHNANTFPFTSRPDIIPSGIQRQPAAAPQFHHMVTTEPAPTPAGLSSRCTRATGLRVHAKEASITTGFHMGRGRLHRDIPQRQPRRFPLRPLHPTPCRLGPLHRLRSTRTAGFRSRPWRTSGWTCRVHAN